MDEQKFIELITKYLSKEASIEEIEQLNLFLENEENYKHFKFVSEKWNEANDPAALSEFNVADGIEKLEAKIKKYNPSFEWSIQGRKKNLFFSRPVFYKAVTLMVVLAALTTGVMYNFDFFKIKQVVPSWNEKVTAMGEKSIITFLDGTRITLNAGSTLKYPAKFGEDSREVYLEGEAFFEVIHDSSKPFIVHTGDISTFDIGTKFNINAFYDEENIAVSLIEGKIEVSANLPISKKGNIILTPSQQLIYNKEQEASKVGPFNSKKTIGWKDNLLVFDNEPLSKVLIHLERYYGVKFELADSSFAGRKIKANFNNDSFWTVADVIKKATGLAYRAVKENDELKKIIFYKR